MEQNFSHLALFFIYHYHIVIRGELIKVFDICVSFILNNHIMQYDTGSHYSHKLPLLLESCWATYNCEVSL